MCRKLKPSEPIAVSTQYAVVTYVTMSQCIQINTHSHIRANQHEQNDFTHTMFTLSTGRTPQRDIFIGLSATHHAHAHKNEQHDTHLSCQSCLLDERTRAEFIGKTGRSARIYGYRWCVRQFTTGLINTYPPAYDCLQMRFRTCAFLVPFETLVNVSMSTYVCVSVRLCRHVLF